MKGGYLFSPVTNNLVSGLGFCGQCEDEKNSEKISSLNFLLLLHPDKSKN